MGAREGFGTGMGAVFGIIAALVALPMCACGGCLGLGMFGAAVTPVADLGDVEPPVAHASPMETETISQGGDSSREATTTDMETSDAGTPDLATENNDAEAVQVEHNFHEVMRISGNGAKKSNVFYLEGRKAGCQFAFRDSSGLNAAIFSASLMKSDGSLSGFNLLANESGSGNSDTTYIHNAKGKFYVDVNAANCSWELVILDLREGEDPKETAKREEEQRKAELAEAERNRRDEAVRAAEAERQRLKEERRAREEAFAKERAEGWRNWTDVTGKNRVRAKYVSFDGTNVVIEKEDGEKVTVPAAKLSKFDQNWVEKRAKAKQP